MLRIKYVPTGTAYSDFNLEKVADELLSYYKDGTTSCIPVSTHNIIEAIRTLFIRYGINHNELVVEFNGEDINLDKFYNYSKFPKGFMDWEKNFLREIVSRRKLMKQ